MNKIYVLCTWGGIDAIEPYVSVHSSEQKAKEHYERLDGSGWFFIEEHLVDLPGKHRSLTSTASNQ